MLVDASAEVAIRIVSELCQIPPETLVGHSHLLRMNWSRCRSVATRQVGEVGS